MTLTEEEKALLKQCESILRHFDPYVSKLLQAPRQLDRSFFAEPRTIDTPFGDVVLGIVENRHFNASSVHSYTVTLGLRLDSEFVEAMEKWIQLVSGALGQMPTYKVSTSVLVGAFPTSYCVRELSFSGLNTISEWVICCDHVVMPNSSNETGRHRIEIVPEHKKGL